MRCLRLLLHLLRGAALIACAYPWLRQSSQLGVKQRWSRQLLDILGVRLDAKLSGIEPASLIVANHISWLDIHALNAARPMAFVAKEEVRQWPLVGWLARKTNTVFLRRGNRAHITVVNDEINRLLNTDMDVAIFPEGTTTDGTLVLEFHGALLQPALSAARPLQPIALSYHDAHGRRSLAPAYAGETTLGECFAAILACRTLTVRLRATPPLDPAGKKRRDLAQAARGAIAFSLGLPLTKNPAELSTVPASRQPGIDTVTDHETDGLPVQQP